MRILIITPYVTITSIPQFAKNKTGFGYMVMDIARSLAEKEQVALLASDTRGQDYTLDRIKFINRSLFLYLIFIFNSLPPSKIFLLWRKYHMKNGALLRIIYYWLMTGYLYHLIKEGKFDVVQIHGCSFYTELWMDVCKRSDQKFIVTLHGLNSFSKTINIENARKQYEHDFLKRVSNGEIPITVISTGMKKKIENRFAKSNCKNIMVVCNSFHFEEEIHSVRSIREKYEIPQSAKLLLYVGNISANKNQKQMVEAYHLLNSKIKEQLYILFCGGNCDMEELVSTINKSNHLILCGSVDKKLMPQYYREADGVVLLSHSEGFGLSLIEGMHFGLPCATFTDLDAFEDIFDDCSVIGIPNRSNEAVAKGIYSLISRSWDKETIKRYSQRFESSTMAFNYITFFQSL